MLLLTLLACALDTRELLELPVHVAPTAPTWEDDGVTVTLTEAVITLSDLRMEAPADPVAWLPSLTATAVAHPGHDFSGSTYGELLGSFTVDLLAADTALATTDAGDDAAARVYEGAFATARLFVSTAHLAGTATPLDGAPTGFAFDVTLEREVTEVPFTATLDAASPPSRLTLRAHLETLLAWADWSTDPGGDDQLTLDDGALSATVPFGVASTTTWLLEATP